MRYALRVYRVSFFVFRILEFSFFRFSFFVFCFSVWYARILHSIVWHVSAQDNGSSQDGGPSLACSREDADISVQSSMKIHGASEITELDEPGDHFTKTAEFLGDDGETARYQVKPSSECVWSSASDWFVRTFLRQFPYGRGGTCMFFFYLDTNTNHIKRRYNFPSTTMY
jgi:hypothetical protein